MRWRKKSGLEKFRKVALMTAISMIMAMMGVVGLPITKDAAAEYHIYLGSPWVCISYGWNLITPMVEPYGWHTAAELWSHQYNISTGAEMKGSHYLTWIEEVGSPLVYAPAQGYTTDFPLKPLYAYWIWSNWPCWIKIDGMIGEGPYERVMGAGTSWFGPMGETGFWYGEAGGCYLLADGIINHLFRYDNPNLQYRGSWKVEFYWNMYDGPPPENPVPPPPGDPDPVPIWVYYPGKGSTNFQIGKPQNQDHMGMILTLSNPAILRYYVDPSPTVPSPWWGPPWSPY